MLSSHASSCVLVSKCVCEGEGDCGCDGTNASLDSLGAFSLFFVLSFSSALDSGRGMAVSCVQSPLVTGNGVMGSGLVLTGVRGGRRLGSRERLMLVSLGRRLCTVLGRVTASSSVSRLRRSDAGGAKGVTGDMRRGFSALPWNGVARVGMATESVLPE